MTNYVDTEAEQHDSGPSFTRLAMIRTARRLMAGLAYVPIEDRPPPTTMPSSANDTVHEGD